MNQIKHIQGNLLDFPDGINVLLHGCNVHGVMGAGIALQIANKYPDASRVDQLCNEQGTNKLGTISVAELSGGKKIVNLYQQTLKSKTEDEKPRNLNFEALYRAMEKTREWLDSLGLKDEAVLGFPLGLASGLAVGHVPGYCPYTWKIVEGMIEANFIKHGYNVTVVEFSPDK